MFYILNLFFALIADILICAFIQSKGIEVNGLWGFIIYIVCYISIALKYKEGQNNQQ